MLNICAPALFNLILSITGIIIMIAFNFSIGQFISSFIYTVGWTYAINALCFYGYNVLAWFLVLFPFIIILLAVLFFFSLFSGMKTATTTVNVVEKAKEALIML